MSAGRITLLAPLAGWSAPLAEAPDEVFAGGLAGEGLAIDPTSDTLCAPCDAEVLLLPGSRHAVTLRAAGGAQLLLHVGIDTVALAGEGFEACVQAGAQVERGAPLIRFDLDFLAQRARSLMTPIVVTPDSGFGVLRRSLGQRLAAGDFLMELAPLGKLKGAAQETAQLLTRRLRVGLAHGIHARPAAQLVASLRPLAAQLQVKGRGGSASARSTVALMALGVQSGEEIELAASGADAAEALRRAAAVLAGAESAPSQARRPEEVPPAGPPPAGTLRGVSASPGIACGSAYQLRHAELQVREAGTGVNAERAALARALTAVRDELTRSAARTGAPAAAAQIAAAHLELLADPELLERAEALILAGKSAGFAWRGALAPSVAQLRALPDERLRERAADLLDLEQQLLATLGDDNSAAAPLPPGAIVLAPDVLPSQLLALGRSGVAGVCMAAGGPTSHASLLAAALGIPALVALGEALLEVPDGTLLVLDAARGALELAPDAARVAGARAALATQAAERQLLTHHAQRAGHTADGTRIEVLANVGSVADAQLAVANGAEGCGLLRTEFLFLERSCAPDEEEQRSAYQRIADALGPRPLTIRTLDAGGDKPLAYLPLPKEANPALGLRGVRTALAYPQLLRTQLRAVLAVRGHCRLLLPMITDVAEVRAVRALLAELEKEKGRRGALAVGVMVETPAAALAAAQLAEVADFFSIGTNDLTQYTLAMDRTLPQLAQRVDALHPAVLRLIAATTAGAASRARRVAVCGGLASQPAAAPLLIGLGVRELSGVPAVIPQLKARLSRASLEACRALAHAALAAEDASAVRALLAAADAPQRSA